jgi:uncharacterized protein (TIGR02588 family)
MAQTPKSAARKTPAKPSASKSSGRARPTAGSTPPLEWASAAVGLVLVVAVLGLTAWDAMFGVASPPSIEVRLVEVRPSPYGFLARIEAVNHGGEPAAQVVVEGVVGDGAQAETASATFDYIPEQSSATGGLIFEHDPRPGALKLQAKGFIDAS